MHRLIRTINYYFNEIIISMCKMKLASQNEGNDHNFYVHEYVLGKCKNVKNTEEDNTISVRKYKYKV